MGTVDDEGRLSYPRTTMSLGPDDLLFGRIALHYKLVTQEQLTEAATQHAAEGGLRGLGEILVEQGRLNERQLEQLRAVQRDYQAKQKTQTAPASGAPAVLEHAADAADTEPPPGSTAAPFGPAPLAWRTAERRLDALLAAAVDRQASDIHVHSGAPLRLRIHGQLTELEPAPLDPGLGHEIIREILTPEQRNALDAHGQVDFSYTLAGVGRFRSNAYRQQRGLDAVFRAIPPEPPTLEALGLPATLSRFCNYHQGMVLLTGPAGCGKSSTMAALLHIINQDRKDHIVTIEDPIEYIHRSRQCVVNQRQVGRHTGSFARALRATLREDPDVIGLGELRDLETISLALTAAETGHLVLATLHTSNAIRTINRILGVFPAAQQDQIRTMLAESLRAVVSQRLVHRADGTGRVPALEVLVCNKAVGNLIRENKTFQIRSVLQTGGAQGMCLLDGSLQELVKTRVITRDEAARHAEEPQKLAAAPAGAPHATAA